MKLHYTLLALAISALAAAPVMAQEHGHGNGDDEARISSSTRISNDIYVGGRVQVNGKIKVNAESASVIDQNQASNHNSQRGPVDNRAKLGGSALSGAEGNIGVNIAAGVGNAQANDAAITAVDGSKVFASAMIFSQQNATRNSMDPGRRGHGHGGGGDDDPNTATLGGSALSNAKGNVGVNIAAGVGNVQGNALAASVNNSGSLAKATSDTDQSTTHNAFNNGARALFTNTATLNGSALSGAQGNIGVNIAAGLSNVQHNSLALATATGQ